HPHPRHAHRVGRAHPGRPTHHRAGLGQSRGREVGDAGAHARHRGRHPGRAAQDDAGVPRHGRPHDLGRREHGRTRRHAEQDRRFLRRRGRRGRGRPHLAAGANDDRVLGRLGRRHRHRHVPADLQDGHPDQVAAGSAAGMKLGDSNRLLRGFGLARLGVAALLLALGPMLPEELMPGANRSILALALLTVVVTSGALTVFTPVVTSLRIAWLICLLDSALVTAVVAATGGARSIFAFLYVLSVTAACVLLSRTGGLTIAAASTVFYTGLVFGRTVLPIAFFEAPKESTALEIITIFLNAGTFMIVAIVAGGLAERFRSTREELETKQADLKDLEAFTDLVFHSVG